MSSFTADWLALREPYDARARSRMVLDAVSAAFADRPSLTVVDLGCGTGSTLRALAPRLSARQHWKLVDNDLGLLARAACAGHARATVVTAAIDLVRDLEAALDGPVDLVATSALLDLVSESWLERFVVEIAARKLPLYAALTVDGRVEMNPSDSRDAAVIAAAGIFHRRDQGFGPALGPDAAVRVLTRLKTIGYAVTHDTADWEFGPQDQEIEIQTMESWAGAARETGRLPPSEIATWLARRRQDAAAGRLAMRIGHVDVFATPIARR
jgi:SAM-dependent methyltransferase